MGSTVRDRLEQKLDEVFHLKKVGDKYVIGNEIYTDPKNPFAQYFLAQKEQYVKEYEGTREEKIKALMLANNGQLPEESKQQIPPERSQQELMKEFDKTKLPDLVTKIKASALDGYEHKDDFSLFDSAKSAFQGAVNTAANDAKSGGAIGIFGIFGNIFSYVGGAIQSLIKSIPFVGDLVGKGQEYFGGLFDDKIQDKSWDAAGKRYQTGKASNSMQSKIVKAVPGVGADVEKFNALIDEATKEPEAKPVEAPKTDTKPVTPPVPSTPTNPKILPSGSAKPDPTYNAHNGDLPPSPPPTGKASTTDAQKAAGSSRQ